MNVKTNYMSLFGTLCLPATLLNAWKTVKSKNSAGGIDGLSVEQFEEKLADNLEVVRQHGRFFESYQTVANIYEITNTLLFCSKSIFRSMLASKKSSQKRLYYFFAASLAKITFY